MHADLRARRGEAAKGGPLTEEELQRQSGVETARPDPEKETGPAAEGVPHPPVLVHLEDHPDALQKFLETLPGPVSFGKLILPEGPGR